VAVVCIGGMIDGMIMIGVGDIFGLQAANIPPKINMAPAIRNLLIISFIYYPKHWHQKRL
jgi:hypothetical protein